jgi:uncharacterized membrane protein
MLYRLVRQAVSGAAWALLVVVGSACGSDDPEAPGQACLDRTLDYAGFGKPFITTYCASCHGGSVRGSARLGAPEEYVFDTLAQVTAKADVIKDQVVVMESMPFGTSSLKPSEAERAKFGRWLDCGAGTTP